MSAIISDCGKYRYRLERAIVRPFISDVDGILSGKTVAFFGVNPSTIDACKWTVATQGRALSRRRKNRQGLTICAAVLIATSRDLTVEMSSIGM